MHATPSIWAIGDIQGCCNSLEKLLAQPTIQQDSTAQLWFAGDLINRGPDSLGALRLIKNLGQRARCVLGNHDIHFLAVYAQARKAGKKDTFKELLNAPDLPELIDWLRHQPLAHFEHGYLMVHAGVQPEWSAQQTCTYAQEIEQVLQAQDWQARIGDLFGNQPDNWRDSLQGDERLRAIINTLTRLRMCHPDGTMDFQYKDAPDPDSGMLPWFELPNRRSADTPILFGHWSTLGFFQRPTLISLDSGCVWGRQLSALRLHDRQLVQVHCPAALKPGA